MVSALIASKNVAEGIAAVAKIPDANLVVAGDGPLRHDLNKLAGELLPGRYRQLTVPAADMPALYRSADVFMHLSTDESFGNVFVEAMASGMPIVAYDTPRTRWIVGNDAFFADRSERSPPRRSTLRSRRSPRSPPGCGCGRRHSPGRPSSRSTTTFFGNCCSVERGVRKGRLAPRGDTFCKSVGGLFNCPPEHCRSHQAAGHDAAKDSIAPIGERTKILPQTLSRTIIVGTCTR